MLSLESKVEAVLVRTPSWIQTEMYQLYIKMTVYAIYGHFSI